MEEIGHIKERYGSAAKEASQSAQRRLQEVSSQAREKSEEMWEETSAFVQKNPGLVIGLALLGGAILGGLIARSWPERESNWTAALPENARRAAQQATKNVTPSVNCAKETVARKLSGLRSFLDEALSKLK